MKSISFEWHDISKIERTSFQQKELLSKVASMRGVDANLLEIANWICYAEFMIQFILFSLYWCMSFYKFYVFMFAALLVLSLLDKFLFFEDRIL